MINTFDSFYYNFGRFPGDLNLISVPQGEAPKFIKSTNIISPLALYGKYLSEGMRGLLCVQFLAALNIFLSGRLSVSKNAMSKLFHNLSYQALSKDNSKCKLEFTAVTLIVKSIIYMLEQKRQRTNLRLKKLKEKYKINWLKKS